MADRKHGFPTGCPALTARGRGGATGRVVRGLRGEHGHEDGEETIDDAPERPAVTVTAPAEELVVLAAVRVVPHADGGSGALPQSARLDRRRQSLGHES